MARTGKAKEIIETIQAMSIEERAELFSQIQGYFCISCGDDIISAGYCLGCTDQDYKD